LSTEQEISGSNPDRDSFFFLLVLSCLVDGLQSILSWIYLYLIKMWNITPRTLQICQGTLVTVFGCHWFREMVWKIQYKNRRIIGTTSDSLIDPIWLVPCLYLWLSSTFRIVNLFMNSYTSAKSSQGWMMSLFSLGSGCLAQIIMTKVPPFSDFNMNRKLWRTLIHAVVMFALLYLLY
jgi:hypothetical protein